MKGKQYRSEGVYNRPTIRYSPEKIRDLLNESLNAISYWQTEALKHEKYIIELEQQVRDLKSQTTRLPFFGAVR